MGAVSFEGCFAGSEWLSCTIGLMMGLRFIFILKETVRPGQGSHSKRLLLLIVGARQQVCSAPALAAGAVLECDHSARSLRGAPVVCRALVEDPPAWEVAYTCVVLHCTGRHDTPSGLMLLEGNVYGGAACL